jgi:hypothetical protein
MWQQVVNKRDEFVVAMKEGLFVMPEMLVGEFGFCERGCLCDGRCGMVVVGRRVARHGFVVARYELYCGQWWEVLSLCFGSSCSGWNNLEMGGNSGNVCGIRITWSRVV